MGPQPAQRRHRHHRHRLTGALSASADTLLFAGHAARMHVLSGGQLDTTPLGAVVREQVSAVVLGRVTTRIWGRLAPHIHPAPNGSTHPRHVHVVQGTTAHSTQVLLMNDTEAADWASGVQTGTT